MKTKLVVQEKMASVVLEAENDFEKEVLKNIERFNQHSVTVTTEQNYGTTVKASIFVAFNTKD